MARQPSGESEHRIVVQTSGDRAGRGWGTKLAVAAAGILACGWGVNQIGGDILPDIDIPFLNGEVPNPGDLANNPPKAEASVRDETKKVEETFVVKCEGRVGVGVSTEGVKDELLGAGKMNKIWFGDFLACGDEEQIMADAQLEVDSEGNVVGVHLETRGLEVTQPRVDMLDPRNCVSLRVDDTQKEIDNKISQWEEAFESGEDPGCDDGFSISGMVGGDGLAKITPTSLAGAQLAIIADSDPGEVLDEMNQSFVEKLKSQLMSRYQTDNVSVKLTTTKDDIIRDLAEIREELEESRYEVSFEEEEKDGVTLTYMKLKIPGAGEVKTDVVSMTKYDIEIEEIYQTLPPIPYERAPR